MSGEDTFIARWSRLKQQTANEKKPRAGTEADRRTPDVDAERVAKAPSRPGHAKPVETEPLFDPASLPPIESIVADSDIRAFLQKGVPVALTKAALRRAWSADPAIRDFMEVAENQWDFTDPTAIPGFGPLRASDSLRQLVDQAQGNLPEVPDVPGPPEESRETVASVASGEVPKECPQVEPAREEECNLDTGDVAAMQHPEPGPPEMGSAPSRKGHGRALPR